LLDGAKEFEARAFDPLAIARRRFTGRDGPIGLETTKVIDPDDIVFINYTGY
jgi:hypothetical protein